MVGDKSDNQFFQFRMGKNYQQVNPEMWSLLDEALYGDDSSEVARIVWWIHQELLVTYEDYLALQAWFLHLVLPSTELRSQNWSASLPAEQYSASTPVRSDRQHLRGGVYP
jgi:hypothetical protein